MKDYLKPEIRAYFNTKIRRFADAPLRIFDRQKPESERKIKNVHIAGICGTATASLAKLFQDQGIIVTGSDKMCYPPMSTVLEDMNITVLPFDTKNCDAADLVIIANACSPTNIEAAYCRENKIPHLSMSEAIREFCIHNMESIVITGTHGKTTTTGMTIETLKNLGADPSFLVGGVNTETGLSAHWKQDSKYFVIEGDEYDTAYFDKSPKFLHYKPKFVVITSIELDHIDIYENITDYTNSFRFLIQSTAPEGCILLGIDDPGCYSLFQEFKDDPRIISYGKHSEASLCYEELESGPNGQNGSLSLNGEKLGTLAIPLFGEYNFQNAVAVFGICQAAGFHSKEILNALQRFPAMKRRQEIVGVKNGITVIDDFAHHPTAVRVTLQGIRERFPKKRIVALFEPRSNTSRGKIFEEEYKRSFIDADMIVISAPKAKEGYNPDEFMDIDTVIHALRTDGKESYAVSSADEAVTLLAPLLRPGDVVVAMSNGSFDGVHQKLLEKI